MGKIPGIFPEKVVVINKTKHCPKMSLETLFFSFLFELFLQSNPFQEKGFFGEKRMLEFDSDLEISLSNFVFGFSEVFYILLYKFNFFLRRSFWEIRVSCYEVIFCLLLKKLYKTFKNSPQLTSHSYQRQQPWRFKIKKKIRKTDQ